MVEPDHRPELRQAYDRKVAERDAAEPQAWKLALRQGFLERLQRARAGSLLEIGPGPGRDALFFQQAGLSVTCADLSPRMAQHCRLKGLAAAAMDVCRLGFAPGSFEAVYTINSLLHLPPDELPAALDEIRRVLKPGGLLFLGIYGGIDHAGVYADDTYEPKRYFCFRTDQALCQAAAGRFEIIAFEPVDTGPQNLNTHFQALTGRRPV